MQKAANFGKIEKHKNTKNDVFGFPPMPFLNWLTNQESNAYAFSLCVFVAFSCNFGKSFAVSFWLFCRSFWLF